SGWPAGGRRHQRPRQYGCACARQHQRSPWSASPSSRADTDRSTGTLQSGRSHAPVKPRRPVHTTSRAPESETAKPAAKRRANPRGTPQPDTEAKRVGGGGSEADAADENSVFALEAVAHALPGPTEGLAQPSGAEAPGHLFEPGAAHGPGVLLDDE